MACQFRRPIQTHICVDYGIQQGVPMTNLVELSHLPYRSDIDPGCLPLSTQHKN
jgi:hypothetical protein